MTPELRPYVAFALAHPVYDPERDMVAGHWFVAERKISGCLTANIGME